MKKEINISLFFLSILLTAAGVLFSSISLMVWGLLITFLSNLLYSSSQIKRDAVFLFFNIAFFIFLLGRIFVAFFFNYNPLDTMIGLDFYDQEIIEKIILMLFISLQSLFLGYYISKHTHISLKYRWSFNFKKVNATINNLAPRVKVISKFLCYFTFLFRIVQVTDIFLFVQKNGYNEYYISFEPSVPSFVGIIASFFSISFFIFIATLPRKKELLIPVSMYLLEAVFSLGTGQRNIFALNILIILIYFIFRLQKEIDLSKIKKKNYVFFFVFSFAVLFIFILVGNLRWGIDNSGQGVFSKIARLFFDQGVSVNLLGYSLSLDAYIPDNKFYTLSPFIRLFKDVFSLFTDIPVYNGQTVENAIHGDAFTYMITYLIMPLEYIKGRGYGSTYIAELFVDFSYYGVIIGNLFYGFLANLFTKSYGKNYIATALSLLTVRYFLFTPRAGYLDFVTYVFSVSNVIYIIGITGICYIYNYYKRTKGTI